MIKNVYEYQENLKKEGVYFSATGPFSNILMEGIADILKQKMRMEKMSVMMNVYSVVVEQVQNMIRYSAEIIAGDMVGEDSPEVRVGTLVIGNENGHYFVISGNQVDNTSVSFLRERLEPLLTMTKDELKKSYKTQRKKKREPGAKGAGLGFIDMARKSSKLEFDFQQVNEQMSFFSLTVII